MNFTVIPNQQTPAVPPIEGDVKAYIEANKEELYAFVKYAETRTDAVGLAANQCAVLGPIHGEGERFMKRAFALCELNQIGTSTLRSWSLIVDPVIIKTEGIIRKMSEGCLTWKHPVKQIIADRAKHIYVSYYRNNGTFVENEKISDFEAQIWQHEINHLNGVPEQIEDLEYRLPTLKIQRNDLCPCNSGKKFKNCCI